MYRNSRFAYAGLLFLATLFLFTFVSDDAEADTIDVDSLGGADYTNLSQAVSNANSGDTINVAARTYTDTVLVNKQLTILGANEGSGKDAGNIFGSAGDLVADCCTPSFHAPAARTTMYAPAIWAFRHRR